MIKLKDGFTGGSFHHVTIESSINELTETLGKPQMINTAADVFDSNVEWNCITDCGINFYIYDWSQKLIKVDDIIRFHIGGKNFMETHTACEKLLKMVKATRDYNESLSQGEKDAINELRDIYNNNE